MTVRRATAEDLPRLAALHAACFHESWNAEAMAALLASPGAFALIDAAQTGFVLVRAVADESEVLTLAVAPAARRRGTATALLESAIQMLAEAGVQALFLEVNAANNAALALYFHLGFAAVARRPGYYTGAHGGREDAIVLRVSIPLSRV